MAAQITHLPTWVQFLLLLVVLNQIITHLPTWVQFLLLLVVLNLLLGDNHG